MTSLPPDHPDVLYFHDNPTPFVFHENEEELAEEAGRRFGETGQADAFKKFNQDCQTVVEFLQEGYRSGLPPTKQAAEKHLGADMTSLWITGNARTLLARYFSSDPVKIYYAMSVTESGPVSLDEPFSAFTIPLMSSGSVFDGGVWVHVRGGIWNVAQALDRINRRLGMVVHTSASDCRIERGARTVRFTVDGAQHEIAASKIVFATDPLSAARLLADEALTSRVSGMRATGTSAKLVMIFRSPIRWIDGSDDLDSHAAFRFVVLNHTLEEFEHATREAARGVDFAPGFLEIYCEGPAQELLGETNQFHLISVFFKNVGFGRYGRELPFVRDAVTRLVCARLRNPDDLIETVLLTPLDLHQEFFFPKGNIDHVELAHGQTFFARNYSPDPSRSFYQFGDDPAFFYCGAGAYPCGSVAGTPGYMCARQIADGESRSSSLTPFLPSVRASPLHSPR